MDECNPFIKCENINNIRPVSQCNLEVKREGKKYLVHDDNLEIADGVGGVAEHVVQNLRGHHEDARFRGHLDVTRQKTYVVPESLPKYAW